MKRLSFYLRYALRALRRDGTRTFLAGLSVAFGVLSLIAMQLLANALLRGAMFDQRLQYGGDAQIQAETPGQALSAADLEQIAAWQQQGLIANYTLVANGTAAYLRTPDNGRVTFLASALGIDPATYPLVGDLVLREPAGATAADALHAPNDALITRDLADKLGLTIGETILLSGDGSPVALTISGIVGATPNQSGDSVFYTLETARLVENREDVVNVVSVTWGAAPGAADTLINNRLRVFVAEKREGVLRDSNGLELFDLMLKGAGVLGLLVGGISLSNTLQVILARRKLEIAMLKTLGFRRGDLLALISLETGLIGLVGALVGAWVGATLAGKLIDVLGSMGSMMLAWTPDPIIVGGGVLAGVMTAVVFGMQAILAASTTRPVQLLRDLPQKTPGRTQAARWGLYALLLLVFGLLVGVVLGSPLEGVLYVFGGGLLLVLLRAVFWAVLWAALKLPLPPLPMLRMARASLRQRKLQSSLAVIALFAGAFSVTFAAIAIYNAQQTVMQARGSDAGYNLMAYTTVAGAAEAAAQMTTQGAQDAYVTERLRGTLNGQTITVEGRAGTDLNKDMIYDGSWQEDQAVGLLPESFAQEHAVGDTLTLEVNGQAQTLTLAGFYTPGSSLDGGSALIVPRRITEALGGDRLQARVIGAFPVETLDAVTTTVGRELPETLVFSRADVNDAMTATYQALFTFAASVAGLAFVAGAVLIANAAGLTVVERRREIGVFKAVGYTSGHVLRLLLSEYGFLGLVAGIFGLVGVTVAITLINASQPGAELVIEPLIMGGMLLFSIGVALASAALVAWQPAHVRPLDVLRYE